MKFKNLLLYIGLAILAFWVLGLVLKLAAWALNLALIIGLALAIVWIINVYLASRKKS